MPALPDFWAKSFAFWIFLVPVHVLALGALVWVRGMFIGAILAFTFFVLSLFGVLAVEVFLVWLTDSDVATQGSYRSRALREWAPWPLGLALGCLPIVARHTYRDYKYKKFLESLQNGR